MSPNFIMWQITGNRIINEVDQKTIKLKYILPVLNTLIRIYIPHANLHPNPRNKHTCCFKKGWKLNDGLIQHRISPEPE